MTHNLLLNYGLYRKMEIYVSSFLDVIIDVSCFNCGAFLWEERNKPQSVMLVYFWFLLWGEVRGSVLQRGFANCKTDFYP